MHLMSESNWRSDPPDEPGFWWMRETRRPHRIISCINVAKQHDKLYVHTWLDWMPLDDFLVGAFQNHLTEWCKAEIPE